MFSERKQLIIMKNIWKKYSAAIFLKFNLSSKDSYINNITIKGPLGILQKKIIKNSIWINWNLNSNLGLKFNILWFNLSYLNLYNVIIISNKYFNIFFKDLEKLIIGVIYGWYISFSIFGRGFSFKVIKRNNKYFLKLKIGYSHFVFYELPASIWVKISKKKNKLFIFSLDFWNLKKVALQIRALRSKHVYKVQGITYFGEVIKLKPGKQKQV